MKRFLRCLLWIVGLCLLSHFEGVAQGNVVTGTVVAASDNAPLPGVTIAVKGESRGTLTDAEGKFSIAADPTDVLVFSFIGMETQETQVGSSKSISIKLVQGATNLDEVVITAEFGMKRVAKSSGYVRSQIKLSNRYRHNKNPSGRHDPALNEIVHIEDIAGNW